MSEYKLRVVLMDEALTFVRSLPLKVQQKITYNFKKTELGVMDKELFKKLENSEIWELRTLFNGNCYRLFSFWDTETETLVIATHGIIKKSQKHHLKKLQRLKRLERNILN